jgi:hypothetical protein
LKFKEKMQSTEYDQRGSRYREEGEGIDKQKAHKMRLSIDIHSIKEANFRGSIFARYNSIPSLGNNKNSHLTFRNQAVFYLSSITNSPKIRR